VLILVNYTVRLNAGIKYRVSGVVEA